MADDLTDEQRSKLATLLRELAEDLPRALELATEGTATVELDQQSVGRLSRMDEMQRQQMAKRASAALKLS